MAEAVSKPAGCLPGDAPARDSVLGALVGDTEFESVTSSMSTERSVLKCRDLGGFGDRLVHYNSWSCVLVDQLADQGIRPCLEIRN
jgi:hypothetical protein